MQLLKTVQQLEHLDYLFRTRSTGNPPAFAKKLNLSKRQVYRLVDELKSLGFPISYCSKDKCYYYHDDVELVFKLMVRGKNILGK